MLPLDLHILGTPPAFILSQDQTLHKKVLASIKKFELAQEIPTFQSGPQLKIGADVDLHYLVFKVPSAAKTSLARKNISDISAGEVSAASSLLKTLKHSATKKRYFYDTPCS